MYINFNYKTYGPVCVARRETLSCSYLMSLFVDLVRRVPRQSPGPQ